MTGRIKDKLNSDSGSVIIEATFVFPIMFIILFFLIYMGNAHYLKAQVESIVEKHAVRGASYCADPILQTLKENGHFPSLSSLDPQPYRYIFGGMDEVVDKINEDVSSEIDGGILSLFNNMSAELKTMQSDIAHYNNYVVYSTFSVEVKYEIKLPIRFMGQSAPNILTINSRAEVPVDDPTEFVRNTDMVIDLFQGTKIGQKVSDVFGKVNDFLSNFASK